MTTGEERPSRSSLFNQSIEKAFAILGLFGAQHSQLSLSEIARLSGMSMGSVQRITHTLEQLGYLIKVPASRKYRIGIKILTVASQYLEADLLVDCANPYLSDLSNRCLETVSLTEPSGLEMVYVARFTSRHYIPIHMPIGSRVPMYCTASGRAFLSAQDETTIRRYLEASELIRYTPDTVTDIDTLLELILACRKRGVAWNNAEYFLGDINIAAPVLNGSGEPVAAVHITAPGSRWTLDAALERLAPPLIECARAITKAARTRM
ncbi:IclR family transcriptional regulator [Halomonas sp. MCCC 1A11057]|jgi:IclR family pca regulon transcriptional regulator|uniref:IclR family transcriptional regulator n=1 Tax=Halomonas sp. MCCC 1A11057 TaxID=2733482 RepID=UPI001F221232|nr:IclR family transcriptional regulator [Halomonas sp. MCCC 1A11057]MCE8031569.1 IclR family transcriptional regulator [Halomonas sp. MCCC 1A11057]